MEAADVGAFFDFDARTCARSSNSCGDCAGICDLSAHIEVFDDLQCAVDVVSYRDFPFISRALAFHRHSFNNFKVFFTDFAIFSDAQTFKRADSDA